LFFSVPAEESTATGITGLISLLSAGVGASSDLIAETSALPDSATGCLTKSIFQGFLRGGEAAGAAETVTGLGTEAGTDDGDDGDDVDVEVGASVETEADPELVLFPSVDAVPLLLDP
jgi:hypothetical protein